MSSDSGTSRSLQEDSLPSLMEELRRRFQAACQESHKGQAPPDLEPYLSLLPEPERSQLRSELEAVVLACRRQSADGGGTVDLPPTAPPGGETIDEPRPNEGGAAVNEMPAAAVSETIDEPAADAVGATTDGDPGLAPGAAPRPSGTVDYEGSDQGTPLPGYAALTGAYEGGSQLLRKAAAKGAAANMPATVAGYEVLGVLGRGAMGVVYKARQRGLNRLVALKMILAGEHAGEHELTRFKTEAEAVARLQHPNIVQIYEVGEEDGKPYFSLEYVDGGSLDRKLRGTPQPPADAARLLHLLAGAMHAAHEKNIIHRDLKPANILLAADGTPKISDFGLAKRLEEDAGQTHSGAILGTPSYMSPEQADGNTQAIGPLSDVYSLGVILYEALTGRVPFRSPTILETLQQVKTREPVAPTQLQPKVPRDLETICLKCLQKDPKKRYASAGALAEDLRRFLSREPILARPVGRMERAWRWCQRNPLGAAVILLIVVWASSTTGLAVAFKWQKNLAEQRERDAIEARNAEQKEKQTLLGNTVIFTNLSADMAYDVFLGLQTKNADANALRNLLLARLANRMEQMAREVEATAVTSFALLAAHQRFGDLLKDLGRKEQALQHYEKGTELARKLVAEQPDSDKAQANLSMMIKRLGDMELVLRSDAEAARRHYREGLRLYQDIVDHPRNQEMTARENLVNLSHHEMALGRAELDLGHPADARAHLTKALDLRKKWWEGSPDENSENYLLAEVWMWQAIADWHAGVEADSREAFGKSLELCEKLSEKLITKDPQSIGLKGDLAEVLGHQGDALLRLGKLAEAKKSYGEAQKNLQFALARQPEDVNLLTLRALTEERLGDLALAEGQREEAGKHFQAALSQRRALLQLDPNQRSMQNAYVLMQAHCGLDAAAAANAEVLLKANPKSVLLLLNAARCYATCAAVAKTPEARKAHLGKALNAVRAALDGGYHDLMVLRTDPDLAPLQKEPAYRALLDSLAKR